MGTVHAISEYLRSYGIDPLIGGFISGIIVCAIARVGIAGRKSAGGSPFSGGPFDSPSLSVAREQTFGSSLKIRVKVNGVGSELGSAESSEVIGAVRRGDKIEAVKLLREFAGMDLKDAHCLVEVIENSHL